MQIKKIAQKIVKIIIWIAGGILILATLLFLLVQINPVQQFLVQKSVGYLEGKIGTPVTVKSIKLKFPKSIAIEGICLEDQEGGRLFSSELISVDIALLKLIKNKMVLNTIKVEGVSASINRNLNDGQFNFDYILDAFTSVNPTPSNTTPSDPMVFTIGKIQLKHIKLKYTDEVEGLNAQLKLEKFKLNFNKTDLLKQLIDIEKVELENTWVKVEFIQKTENNVTNEIVEIDEAAGVSYSEIIPDWKIKVSKVNFNNIELVYNNFNSPKKTQGIDFSHLRLTNMNLSARELSYGSKTISGQINNLSFNSAGGFALNKLQTKFEYSSTYAKLENFYLETPYSQMYNQIEARFPSIEDIMSNPEHLILNLEINKNLVGFPDLLTFFPELSTIDPFRLHPEASISFSGTITGSLSQLSLQQILISTLNDTRLQFSCSMSGTIIGSMSQVKAQLNLQSTLGNAILDAQVLNYDKTDKATYTINIYLDQLNAGKLLSMEPSLGKLSGNAKITGQGFDPKNMHTQIESSIDNLDFLGYSYQNLLLNGKMDQNQVWANLHINNRHIGIEMDAHADLSNTFPAADFTLKIETLNLQALNLYDTDLILSGLLTANFPSTNPDSLVGTAETSELLLVSNGTTIPLGKLKLVANSSQNEQQISLNSEIVQASLNGNYQLTKLIGELLSAINLHLSTNETRDSINSYPQQFVFTAIINNHPIIKEFIPQLSHFEPIQLSGKFNSQNNTATLQADVLNLIFSNININELEFELNNNSDSLSYLLTIEQVKFEGIEINNIAANGGAKNKQANLWFIIKDLNQTVKYQFGATATFTDSLTLLKLMPDRFLMNYQPWNVQADNIIEIDSTGFDIRNLRFWSQNQELKIEGNGTSPGAPLQIDLTNFRISTLAAIAETDTLIANGIINGQLQVRQLNTAPVFESDLYIADFSFYNDTIGNIQLKANNIEPNYYTARALISGKGNELILDGYYHEIPEDGNQFSFDANVQNFSLATAEPFTMGYLRNLSGSMNGKMNITGTVDHPKIRGNLGFDQASFNVDMLNTTFSIDNESIEFVPDGINFDNFALSDENSNKLTVNGKLLTTNYRDYSFGLDINSQNFKVLNSTRADNNLFYGQVFLNTTLRIRGDSDNPQVEGLIRINPQTDFTFIVPQISPELIEREDVVEFVDMSNIDSASNNAAHDSLNISSIKGLDVAMSIEIDTTSIFTVIVDENSGDRLKIQGDARLTAGIDPGGHVNLSGTYEVTRGSYELSFNMISRKFKIELGSQITWQGQPMDAITNITANYTTNTSAYNLVENKLNESTASLNRYKQRLPFEVHLKMQGELLKPQLSFDIKLPDGNYNVASDVVSTIQNQLVQLRNNESELNKQVFSLLLLNNFVANNPFTASSTSSIESTARSSASRLLSDQMNQLAGNLIQGVDFNFDLVSDEDYTTGSQQYRTDLNVDVSKNMFNDRLKVSVGSNFELEKPQDSNREATNLAGNVALDYRLSRDSRYQLRVYRKNEYQGVAEGYIIETGVGFIFTFDYSKISEITKRKEEETP